MVKTVGPLLSADAHGSIADILTFSHRKSGKQVRTYHRPLKIPTAKQRGQRRLTEFLVAHWQSMSDATKIVWAAKAQASGLNIAGYHYFLREAQRDLYTHHGLCAYWHCNEIVAGKILDLSGNENHGTLKPTYPSNAPSLVTSKTTKFGLALSLDGDDDNIEVADANSLDLGTGDFTLIAWVLFNVLDVEHNIIFKREGYGAHELRFYVYSDNKLSLRANDESNHTRTYGPHIVTANQWYQIVATRAGTTQKVYINTLAGTPITLTAYDLTNAQKLYLGIFGGAAGVLNGVFDEICIYNRAFSAAEISTRYKFARA